MGLGLISDELRGLVRRLLGLPDNPGQPPDLIRLGLYRARVDVCSSSAEGTTLDVTPEDSRISPEKGVPLRVPFPCVVAVATGAIVHLGWEKGDPGRPYCAPIFEDGASLVSLTIGSSADPVITKADFDALIASLSAVKYSPGPSTPALLDFSVKPLPTTYGSTTVKVQR